MSLICNYEDDGDCAWYYVQAKDLVPLATRRGRRCCSCNAPIKVGESCLKYTRFRAPRNNVEERIYGEDGEICMADQFMCERCSDLAFNLEELGYCTPPGDDMRELVKEYAEMVKGQQEAARQFKEAALRVIERRIFSEEE